MSRIFIIGDLFLLYIVQLNIFIGDKNDVHSVGLGTRKFSGEKTPNAPKEIKISIKCYHAQVEVRVYDRAQFQVMSPMFVSEAPCRMTLELNKSLPYIFYSKSH